MKHLLAESDEGERLAVEDWLAEDAANQTYYDQLKNVWEKSRTIADRLHTDENEAWERFRSRINADRRQPAPKRWLTPLSRIAAAVVLLIGLSWVAFNWWSSRSSTREMLVLSDIEPKLDTLPDGSTALLNKHSSISYPSKFSGSERPIRLKGEAFFRVTPDKDKPFVISVNDVKVTVVGTSFNVRSEAGRTEVIVETGIVRVEKDGKTVELRPNERIAVDSSGMTMVKSPVKDHLYNYYRTKEFVCDDTPLWKLVEVLNEAYDARIVFAREELKELKMNTTFNNESLEQVLQVISLTFGITAEREGDRIILK